jgi:4-hydroxy-tetrahydrodipicolinate synthase
MNPKYPNNNINHCCLWTALITPFDAQGQIQLNDLRHIAQSQADAGNGILLLGSTGEGLALTYQEKQLIVQTICAMALAVPIMVAVGGHHLAEQVRWVTWCNEQPIDAYLLSTPLYAKPGIIGQNHWFGALLDAANLPCMLYNVPSRSAVAIPIETVQQLQHHQNCWGMKEASGDLAQFLAYRQACPSLVLFCGDDGLLPYLVCAGAHGLVSVCSNAWPEASHRYVNMALQGDAAQQLLVWRQATASLFTQANPIPVKVLMHLQQEITEPLLRAPLTHLELTNTDAIIQADQQITDWLIQQNLSQQSSTQEMRQQATQRNIQYLVERCG